MAFRDANYGVAVGGDYKKPAVGGISVVAVTRDGGATWQSIIGPGPSGFRSAVASTMVDDRQAFVTCGPNGCDISFDGGQSWRPVVSSPDTAAFHAIQFANGTGFGVGAAGKVGKVECERLP